jgi:hypothetical protein
MAEALRRPDVVIIGAMKSATTSLFRWLDEQPETFMAHPKETRFFSDLWSNGLDWYLAKFAGARPDQVLGEASQSYTSPEFAADAARRMAEIVPEARLIYVIRQPIDRLRSHYRWEAQRARESRPLREAIREPGNPYVGHSCYYQCLSPYIERFPRERILVVRFEDLVRPPAPAWSEVLRSLSLPDRPLPEEAHNVSADQGEWTRAMAWAKGRGLMPSRRVARLPGPIRRIGKHVLTRKGAAYVAKVEASRAPIPDDLLAPIWEDVARLEAWLGAPLWRPEEPAARAKAAG